MGKSIPEIHLELSSKTSFRTKTEVEMFEECIQSYFDKRFFASSSVGTVLFEKIFYSRLHTETYLPDDFTPTTGKENVTKHIQYYLNREREINDGDKEKGIEPYSFYDVTEELESLDVISKEEKRDYDSFYKKFRIPISHGLTMRLFETIFDRRIEHINEMDMRTENLHEHVSEIVIRKIHEISKIGGIWG